MKSSRQLTSEIFLYLKIGLRQSTLQISISINIAIRTEKEKKIQKCLIILDENLLNSNGNGGIDVAQEQEQLGMVKRIHSP